MEERDSIAQSAIAVAGREAVAAVLAAAASIPPTDDPWLAPAVAADTPPELELPPRAPR